MENFQKRGEKSLKHLEKNLFSQFLEIELARADAFLLETEKRLEITRENKKRIIEKIFLRLNFFDKRYQREINLLETKLHHAEQTLGKIKKVVENLIPESYPPCEREMFRELKKIFEEEYSDVNKK